MNQKHSISNEEKSSFILFIISRVSTIPEKIYKIPTQRSTSPPIYISFVSHPLQRKELYYFHSGSLQDKRITSVRHMGPHFYMLKQPYTYISNTCTLQIKPHVLFPGIKLLPLVSNGGKGIADTQTTRTIWRQLKSNYIF